MKDLFLEMGGTPMIVTVADGEGEAIINGRKWMWEFHEMFGPIFLRKDGEPKKHQPGENHPVWKAFESWLEKREKLKKGKR